VPRISDLGALAASTNGKIEFEYTGADASESEVIGDLVRRATRTIFDATCSAEDLASVVAAFDAGWNVEVSSAMPSPEYLAGLEEITGLREAAAGLAGGDQAPRVASAIEFLLEGLHLANKLNKSSRDEGARYTAP